MKLPLYAAAVVLLVLISLCDTAQGTFGWRRYRSSRSRYSSCKYKNGQTCKPSSYGLYNVCGERKLLSTYTNKVTSNFGPNVCKTKYTYGRNAYRYQYSGCNVQYSYWYGYKCSSSCKCTKMNVCDVPITLDKSEYHCCDGYTTKPVASDNGYRYSYEPNTYNILCTEGCPVAMQDTVVDCLEELGLTTMKDLLCGTDLEATLNATDRTFTVFGVPNDVLDGTELATFSDEEINEVLSRHVIEAENPLRSVTFTDGESFETLVDSCFVHVNEIEKYKQVWSGYRYGYKKKHDGDRIFISGSEIEVRDACIARNGIVHIVQRPVECGSQTIATIVQEDSDFSNFESLLEAGDLLGFLNNSSPLLTLFAPTDAAFMEAQARLRYNLVACLRNNSDALHAFLKYHIVCNAEFSSTMILQKNLKTKACEKKKKTKCTHRYWGYYRRSCRTYYVYECETLSVSVGLSGIQIGKDEVSLTQLDNVASNGVIHEIAVPLLVPTVDFDELCSGFVGVVGPPPPPPPPPPSG